MSVLKYTLELIWSISLHCIEGTLEAKREKGLALGYAISQ